MNQQTQIASIHQSDVQIARYEIHKARSRLSENWVPCNAVLDALLQELAEMAFQRGDSHSLAGELRRVATLIEQAADQRQLS